MYAIGTTGYQFLGQGGYPTAHQHRLNGLPKLGRECHRLAQQFAAHRCKGTVLHFGQHPDAARLLLRSPKKMVWNVR